MDKCCLNCRNYVTDYGYWFCRKENDDEHTDVTVFSCQEHIFDDDIALGNDSV